MDATIVFILVAMFLTNTIAGSIAGRSLPLAGALLGFFLGPVGVVAALGLDGRPQCPRCAGRLDGCGRICQYCAAELEWPAPAPNAIFATIGKPLLRAPAQDVTAKAEKKASPRLPSEEDNFDRWAQWAAGGDEYARAMADIQADKKKSRAAAPPAVPQKPPLR
jgi:hypothetical protein